MEFTFLDFLCVVVILVFGLSIISFISNRLNERNQSRQLNKVPSDLMSDLEMELPIGVGRQPSSKSKNESLEVNGRTTSDYVPVLIDANSYLSSGCSDNQCS
jgi:hypothetical protein